MTTAPTALQGLPLTLNAFPARTVTSARFAGVDLERYDRVYLPPLVARLMEGAPAETLRFIEDDNRGAIFPEPVATLAGLPFFLSVKGVGSTVDPFAERSLDRDRIASLSPEADLRERFASVASSEPDRMITGELWLRGSPYGGQGLEHATTALRVSERAETTNLAGFHLCPVMKIAFLPEPLEERLRQLYWYRRYRGRFVQELRLVPSNVRIYFHSQSTVAGSVRALFDRFGIRSRADADRFAQRFVASAIAMLTLFARTMVPAGPPGHFRGLDFHDVWLDKDAVVAPDGTIYFVDLEGIDEVEVTAEGVGEKAEDQIYRSLYEFMFAYEQIDLERRRRFGDATNRRERFEATVLSALADDPVARPRRAGRTLELEVRNPASPEALITRFPLVDR